MNQGGIGSAFVNAAGVAYFDTARLTPGVHSLSAQFQGITQTAYNDNTPYVSEIFLPSSSGSSSVTVTSNLTSIGLTASSSTADAGTVLTFTSQVTSSAGIPFGGASFYDGDSLLGTLWLDSSGKTSFSSASLAVGSHVITSTFNANGAYAASTSNPLSVSITPGATAVAPSLIALVRQIDAATDDSSLVATISSIRPPSSGNVVFLDGGVILGTAPIDTSGVARLLIAKMDSGNHAFTASFRGTAQYAPSVSPVLSEEWPSTGPGFSLVVTAAHPSTATAAASLLVDLEPFGDFRHAVELSCASGLPIGYTCTFSPRTVNGPGKALLSILPSSTIARRYVSGNRWPGIAVAFGLALLVATGARLQSRFLLLLFAVSLLALGGCRSLAPTTPGARIIVLTVEASTAVSGSHVIIHSAQSIVRLQGPN